MNKALSQLLAASFLLAFSHAALAHTGVATAMTTGFSAGFLHPLLGLDHLLAMLAVGLWAGQNSGRLVWLAPLTFMATMAVGGYLGIIGFALPMAEQGILTSLIVFGSLIMLSVRPNVLIAISLISAFALFHGHAHGSELVNINAALEYTIGFVLATGLLHLIGIIIARSYLFQHQTITAKIAGSSIIAVGIALMILQ